MRNVLVVSSIGSKKRRILCKKKIQKFLLGKCNLFRFVSLKTLDEIDIENFDTIVAVGGDGTVSNVLKYVVNSNKTLAIVPAGSANLLAQRLGISNNIDAALEVITKYNATKIDALRVNETYSILRIGFGYDRDIIVKAVSFFKKYFGYWGYFVCGVFSALTLKIETYKIEYDDKKLVVDASDVIISNAGNLYKNLFSVAKDDSLTDGVFEIFMLKAKNPIIFLYELVRILLNIKHDNSRALYLKASKLNIKNAWRLGHIDGEEKNFTGNINVEILPKAVNVFVP